jgi:hypothetical protein
LGRVKVRIFGLHTEERTTIDTKQYLPVSDLPWAEAAFPISSANISGISDFMIPQEGSYVWLFFKDVEQQYPVYFATSPKIEKVPDFTKGFSDPNLTYPDGTYTDESGISKLAKGTNTITKVPKTSVSANAKTWSEPTQPYGTTYPENRVIQTKQHVIELDDTSTKERIHIYHKSGSFTEYHPDGSVVEKVKTGKRYLVIEASDNNIYVKGDYNLTIDGDCNIEVAGACNITGNTIVLDGGGGNIDGVITGQSICPFTGNPHIDASTTVDASK